MKRKWGVVLAVLALAMFWSFSAQAYTINDAVPDSIGYPTFETYGMNVLNFTPGTYSGNIGFQLFTNFSGVDTVNGSPPWTTTLADLFITENYHGVDYNWAIPLVNRTGFTAGNLYAVGSALTSTDVYNANGGGNYTYNPNVNVLINAVGNNYGFTSIGGGSVTATGPSTTMPYWQYNITTGFYEDDPSATCPSSGARQPAPMMSYAAKCLKSPCRLRLSSWAPVSWASAWLAGSGSANPLLNHCGA